MGRKPPSSRKQKPRQALAEDIIAAQAAVDGTFNADGPAPPSFIPEGHTSLTDATASIEGGWLKLRQHLHAGRIRGFIWTEHGQLVPVPAKDWGSPENDEAGQTGRAIKLNRAIVGGSDAEGFALVKASDLTAIRPSSWQSSAKSGSDCQKWLISEMAEGREKTKPKSDYAEKAKKRF